MSTPPTRTTFAPTASSLDSIEGCTTIGMFAAAPSAAFFAASAAAFSAASCAACADLRIFDEFADQAGIYSACVGARTRHLMIVDFDPEDLRPSEIVHNIRDRGLHASMIGL